MSSFYDDAKYGVEKIFLLPVPTTAFTATAAFASIVFTEDITITELGIMVSTAVSSPTNPVLSLNDSDAGTVITNNIATIAITSTTAIGTLVRTTCASTSISAGDTLRFMVSTVAVATAGAGYMYFKYKSRA